MRVGARGRPRPPPCPQGGPHGSVSLATPQVEVIDQALQCELASEFRRAVLVREHPTLPEGLLLRMSLDPVDPDDVFRPLRIVFLIPHLLRLKRRLQNWHHPSVDLDLEITYPLSRLAHYPDSHISPLRYA